VVVAQVLAVLLGVWVVVSVLLSAIRTVVVPRGESLALTSFVFVGLRRVLHPMVDRMGTVRRERLLARYAALSLMFLAASWSVLVIAGYTLIFWGVSGRTWTESLEVSGSSLTTLGFLKVSGAPTVMLSVSEALIGLGLVGLLISFLPTMYSIYNRRELAVAQLATRAGTPPSVATLVTRLHRIHGLDELDDMWSDWEEWFADLEETHTSYPALVYFRSGHGRSWLTSAGAVLDAAAVVTAAVDVETRPQAQLCLRAGFLALREVADHFGQTYDPDPSPGAPISVTRAEFDVCLAELEEAGVPLRADRDQAWRDFAGWRVNYDAALVGMCSVIEPPPAPWSSDRAPRWSPPFLRTVWWARTSGFRESREMRRAEAAS
jgi:hypothetical protein